MSLISAAIYKIPLIQLLVAIVLMATSFGSFARGGPPAHAGGGLDKQQMLPTPEIYLQGITFFSSGHNANIAAVLMPDKTQLARSVGENLPGTMLSIVEIGVDYILLEDSQSLRLRLNLNDALRLADQVLPSEPPDAVSPKHIWLQKPGNRGKTLRFEPVYSNQQLLGIRILPSGQGDRYHSSGLRRQDIVIAVNGVPMNAPEGLDYLHAIVEASDVLTLLIERDGQIAQRKFKFK